MSVQWQGIVPAEITNLYNTKDTARGQLAIVQTETLHQKVRAIVQGTIYRARSGMVLSQVGLFTEPITTLTLK
jgi:hypothetical protein